MTRETSFTPRTLGTRSLVGPILWLLLLLAAAAAPAWSQAAGDPVISPQIVSSGGEIQQGEFGEVFSTIGEPFAGDSTAAGAVDGDATWTGFWNVVPSDTSSGVREEWNPNGKGTTGVTSAAPNPFTREVTLYIRVEKSSQVRLIVYDLLGRERATLIDGAREAGTTRIHWEPQGIEAGTYMVALDVNGIGYEAVSIMYTP
jgi:hypothetical protein